MPLEPIDWNIISPLELAVYVIICIAIGFGLTYWSDKDD